MLRKPDKKQSSFAFLAHVPFCPLCGGQKEFPVQPLEGPAKKKPCGRCKAQEA